MSDPNDSTSAKITAAVGILSSNDGEERQKARASLVGIGAEAVAPLTALLASSEGQLRWEATKTLFQLSDPSSAEAMVGAMGDEKEDVRWLAAETLIVLGITGARAILRRLATGPDDIWVRKGALHVLRKLAHSQGVEHLSPVINALAGNVPSEVPVFAEASLESLGTA